MDPIQGLWQGPEYNPYLNPMSVLNMALLSIIWTVLILPAWKLPRIKGTEYGPKRIGSLI